MPKETIVPLLFLFFLSACQDIPQHIKTGLEGRPIPYVDLLLSDSSTHINTAKTRPGSPTALIYIDPNCPFCNGLMKDIADNMVTLQDIQFYIVAMRPFRDMIKFSKTYELEKYRNVSIGLDDKKQFVKYFSPPGYPYIAIYRSDNTLSKVFLGKLNISEIAKATHD